MTVLQPSRRVAHRESRVTREKYSYDLFIPGLPLKSLTIFPMNYNWLCSFEVSFEVNTVVKYFC